MCGILAVFNTHRCQGLARIGSLGEVIRHRGPDDEGFVFLGQGDLSTSRFAGPDTPGNVLSAPYPFAPDRPLSDSSPDTAVAVLAHRRLSILDLSPAGHQPMCSRDGRLWITYNGEVYNYVELRTELQALGHTFQSGTDTEVILAAYDQWGTACQQRFQGMWAFVLFDSARQQVFVSRDPFGIKPLYHARWRGGIAFSSEIKPLLELPGVSRQVNGDRLFQYLRYAMTDYGAETMFADVHQVPAAHGVTFPIDAETMPAPIRYWALDLTQQADLSFPEAASRLRELFLANVQRHLRSDVPVGAALSGGVDSSALVMAMRHLVGDRLELHTFSYLADDEPMSEERWADLVGQAAGATMHKVRPASQELVDDLEFLLSIQEEPFGSTSIYAQHRVFRLASQAGIKVMLDGQGADEMLAGYRVYAPARLASLIRKGQWTRALDFYRQASRQPGASQYGLQAVQYLLPRAMQSPLRRLAKRDPMPGWLNATWFEERRIGSFRYPEYAGPDFLRQKLLETLTETSLPQLLRYEDRNSMAHSIESRVPFLTTELASFIFSLPEEYLIAQDGTTKAVFRAAMRGLVPDAILDRKDKIGFATPEQAWLKSLRPWVEGLLASETARRLPVLRLDEVERQWRGVLNGSERFDFRIWRWCNLIRWSERFEAEFS